MRNRKSGRLTALVTCLALLANGCASSGSGTQASGVPKVPASIPGWDVVTLENGKNVVLWLRDGTHREGRYRGLVDVPQAEYVRRYASSRDRTGAETLPDLGPGLKVRDVTGAERVFDFVGVEPRNLRLRMGPKDYTHVKFDRVASAVDGTGHTVDGAALERLARGGKVPLLYEILLEESKGKSRVPLEDVTQVDLKAAKGGGAGKAITIAVVVAAVVGILVLAGQSGKDPAPPPQELQVCSPLVSSYDGEGYVADADVFGGALHRRAKRTDFDSLDHLRASDGHYRLRIDKTHAETEYVDELALVAVEHAAGTRVLPDGNGVLRSFVAPHRPLRAETFRGDDVTGLVARRDDSAWISSPFGRDPDSADDVRDGLVVEFARPAGSDAVKLALRLQNTSWAYYLRHRFLELLGRDVDRWYAGLDASPEQFAAFDAARQREIALQVQVWDGSGWRRRALVPDLGSALFRDLAVVLDVRDLPADRLRVRLDSTVGLWMVDSIEADFSKDAELPVREIRPTLARDEHGSDVTAALLAADDRSYEMTDASTWAEVTFDAPPCRPGLERTLVLRANGYYRIHVHSDGEPQPELVRRLIQEPGAFGRYSLRLLNEHERPLVALAQPAGR
jgi:hypothetical protein